MGWGLIYRRGSGQGSGRTFTRGHGRDWVGPKLGIRAETGSGLSRMSEQGRTRGLSMRKGREYVTRILNLRKDRVVTQAGDQGMDGALS